MAIINDEVTKNYIAMSSNTMSLLLLFLTEENCTRLKKIANMKYPTKKSKPDQTSISSNPGVVLMDFF